MTTATFKSYNKEIGFLSLISKAGISAKLVSLDSSAVERGCNYGVRINKKYRAKATSLGVMNGITPERWL